MERTGLGNSQSSDDGKLNSPRRCEHAPAITPKANHEREQWHLPGSDTPHWFCRTLVFAAETRGFASALRSAGFQPAVSPTFSRQGVEKVGAADQSSRRLRIGNPRYGRLEVCATTGWRGIGGVRSAGFQPAVSPTSSRQRVEKVGAADQSSRRLRIGNPRYGRLEVRATRTSPSPDNRRLWGSRAGLRPVIWQLSDGCGQ
jgi:hypothetical protein